MMLPLWRDLASSEKNFQSCWSLKTCFFYVFFQCGRIDLIGNTHPDVDKYHLLDFDCRFL